MSESEEHDLRQGGAWTRSQRRKNDAIYLAATIALGIARRAPRAVVAASTQLLAMAVWLAWSKGRRATDARLARALAEHAPSSLEVFRGLGRVLADTLHVLHAERGGPMPLVLEDADREVLASVVSANRGVVFATAHLGAWEAIGPLLATSGFRVATVARRSYDPRFDRLYAALREAHGVRALYRGDPGFAKALLKELRAGAVVGFTMDLAGRGVRVVNARWPDGDRPTPLGPAELALRIGATIVVGTAAPGARLRIEVLAASPDESAIELTERLATALGARVLDLPEAWPWMHESSPSTEPSAASLPIPVARR